MRIHAAMKKTCFLLISYWGVLVLRACRHLDSGSDRVPAIAVHRAGWNKAPENSLAAIEASIWSEADIVEVDVQRSIDGEFFLSHDHLLNRMAVDPKYEGVNATHLTLKELRTIRLRDKYGGADERPTLETIPSLRDALRTARGKIYMDIDVKEVSFLPRVADIVQQEGMIDQVSIKTVVQNEAQAQILRDLQSKFGIMVMPKTGFTTSNADDMVKMLSNLGVSVVEARTTPEFSSVGPVLRKVRDLSCANISVWVNTLSNSFFETYVDHIAVYNPLETWGVLISKGVRAILTNEPEQLAKLRSQMNMEANCGCRRN